MLTNIGVQKWILNPFAFLNRESWTCNNFYDKLGSVLGTSITEFGGDSSFLSSMLNNKLWFSKVFSLSVSLHTPLWFSYP